MINHRESETPVKLMMMTKVFFALFAASVLQAANIPSVLEEEPDVVKDGSQGKFPLNPYPTNPRQTSFATFHGLPIEESGYLPEDLEDYDTNDSEVSTEEEIDDGWLSALHVANYSNNYGKKFEEEKKANVNVSKDKEEEEYDILFNSMLFESIKDDKKPENGAEEGKVTFEKNKDVLIENKVKHEEVNKGNEAKEKEESNEEDYKSAESEEVPEEKGTEEENESESIESEKVPEETEEIESTADQREEPESQTYQMEEFSEEGYEQSDALYPMLLNNDCSCAPDAVLQTLLILTFKPFSRLISGDKTVSNEAVKVALANINKPDHNSRLTKFFSDLKDVCVNFELLYSTLSIKCFESQIAEASEEERAELEGQMEGMKKFRDDTLTNHDLTLAKFKERSSLNNFRTPASILSVLREFYNKHGRILLDADETVTFLSNMLTEEEIHGTGQQSVMHFTVERTWMYEGKAVSTKSLTESVITLDARQRLELGELMAEYVEGRCSGEDVAVRSEKHGKNVSSTEMTKLTSFPTTQVFKIRRTPRSMIRTRRASFYSHRPIDVPLQLAVPYNSVLRAVICYDTRKTPHYYVIVRDGVSTQEDDPNIFTLYDGLRRKPREITSKEAMERISRMGQMLFYQAVKTEVVEKYVYSEIRPALNYPTKITTPPKPMPTLPAWVESNAAKQPTARKLDFPDEKRRDMSSNYSSNSSSSNSSYDPMSNSIAIVLDSFRRSTVLTELPNMDPPLSYVDEYLITQCECTPYDVSQMLPSEKAELYKALTGGN